MKKNAGISSALASFRGGVLQCHVKIAVLFQRAQIAPAPAGHVQLAILEFPDFGGFLAGRGLLQNGLEGVEVVGSQQIGDCLWIIRG